MVAGLIRAQAISGTSGSSLKLKAVNSISISPSITLIANGEIDIYLDSTPNAYNADSHSTRPAGVDPSLGTNISITSPGNIYWGDDGSVYLTTPYAYNQTFIATSLNIVFDANGNPISIGNGVSFIANPAP